MSLFCKQSHVTNSGQWSGSRSDESLPSCSIQILSLEPRELFFTFLWWCVHLRGLIYQPMSLCDYSELSITSTCNGYGALSRKHPSLFQVLKIVALPLPDPCSDYHTQISCLWRSRGELVFSTYLVPSTAPFDSVFPSICIELPLSI